MKLLALTLLSLSINSNLLAQNASPIGSYRITSKKCIIPSFIVGDEMHISASNQRNVLKIDLAGGDGSMIDEVVDYETFYLDLTQGLLRDSNDLIRKNNTALRFSNTTVEIYVGGSLECVAKR